MNSNKAFKAVLFSALLLVGGPVLAARGFSYSFADVGYNRLSGDSSDFDMDAAQVDASFGVSKYVALRAGYIRGYTDGFPKNQDSSGDPDLNEFRFGLEPHYSLFKSLDAFVDLIYVNRKFNGDRSNTDIGYIYAGGVRYQALKRLELRITGEYRSGDINKAFVSLTPVIKLTRRFDASFRASYNGDSQDYFAGVRLKF